MISKPKLGVFKFASCDGCQLSLLSAEDQLIDIADSIEIAYFLEATSRIQPGPYDITLVEGSITTESDAQRIKQVREESKYLITIGACATAGGIQSLRNWGDTDEYVNTVYATPDYISTLDKSTAIAEHVKVDFELRGCPVNHHQLVEVIRSLLSGRRPRTPSHSVCLDCKRRGTVCVMVAQGIACLGPVTQAGCDAICPSFNRGCYGCYGPTGQPNLISLSNQLSTNGSTKKEIIESLRSFNADAKDFKEECNRLESTAKPNRDAE